MLENLFTCIGAQKAGTSWLHAVLSQDPSFAACPYVKEVHYFDFIHCNSIHLNNWRAQFLMRSIRENPQIMKPKLARWLDEISKPQASQAKSSATPYTEEADQFYQLTGKICDDWYASLLTPRHGQNFSLDITPDYTVIGAKGFTHLKSIAKNLKILLILREPISRAWSGILQGKKRAPGGIENFLSVAERNSEKIIRECTLGKDVGARTNYLKILDDLDTAGLSSHVLIKFYDEIEEDPRQFIADLYGSLGKEPPWHLPEFSNSISKTVYATPGKQEMPESIRMGLGEFFRPQVIELNNRFRVPSKWLLAHKA